MSSPQALVMSLSASAVQSAPPVPTNLVASQPQGNQVRLTWGTGGVMSSSDAFRIERSVDGGLTFTKLAELASSFRTYTDTVQRAKLYVYRIQAFNFSGASAYAASASILTVPPDIVAVQATGYTTTSISLEWTPSSGATGYEIDVSREGGPWSLAQSIPGGTFAATVGNLDAGTQYSFRLRATNAGGSSAPGNPINLLTIPVPPTNLNLQLQTLGGLDGVMIAFTGSKGANGYRVERESAGRPWSKLTDLPPNVTTYFDTQVLTGDVYGYRVRANSVSGDSANSEALSILVGDGSTLVVPDNLTYTIDSKGAAVLNWTCAGDPTGFVVERLFGGTWRTTATLTASAAAGSSGGDTYSATLKGLSGTSGTRVRVRSANNTQALSSPSDELLITLPPPSPTKLRTLTPATASQVKLTWTATNSSSRFKLERSTDRTNWTVLATDFTLGLYTDSDVQPGTTYYYRVSAGNSGGYSKPSVPLVLLTPPSAPSNLSITAGLKGFSTFSWSDVDGESGFRLLGSSDGGATYRTIASTKPNQTTLSFKAGKYTLFEVVAINRSGASAPSPAASLPSALFSDVSIR